MTTSGYFFEAMRRINKYFRLTINQYWFTNLVFFYIEKYIEIDLEIYIDRNNKKMKLE